MSQQENSSKSLKRFYELKDIGKLNNELNKTDPIKIFICNHCQNWNRIKESEIISEKDLVEKRKQEKVDMHIRVTPDFKIKFKQFADNFGTAERALIVALDDFYKHNR